MKKKVTIKDVAKASGVSITTVSMILNQQANRFSKETVEKVLKAKAELSYEPNYYAQKMITKRSYTIGILVSDLSNPFFYQLVQGIQKELIQKGYLLVLCDTSLDETRETDYLEELTRREVDGIIIASAVGDPDEIGKYLKEKEIPYLFLDQQQGKEKSLSTDDYTGGKLVAEHLLSLKHTCVALLYPENLPENIATRKKGFIDVFKHSHGKVIEIPSSLSKEGGYQSVGKILKIPKITGIFTMSDEVAVGVYRGLKEANKKIPEDYSVVGYDDIALAAYLDPKLTTVHQPIEELGQKASALILQEIETDYLREKEVLSVSFITRNSTKNLS